MNCNRVNRNQKFKKITYQLIMKPTLFLCLSISVVLIGCDSQAEQDIAEVPVALQESIKSKLEGIALDFLKSWEPPYDPDAALALFTQREDFHLVIGGGYTAIIIWNGRKLFPVPCLMRKSFIIPISMR